MAACGCGPQVADGAGSGSGTTGGSESSGSGGEPEEVVLYEEPFRRLDVLFVVDNSQSTAALGAKLAETIEVWLAALEAPDARVDYRLAVTTTDSGNLSCDQITTPERGRFVDTRQSQPGESGGESVRHGPTSSSCGALKHPVGSTPESDVVESSDPADVELPVVDDDVVSVLDDSVLAVVSLPDPTVS